MNEDPPGLARWSAALSIIFILGCVAPAAPTPKGAALPPGQGQGCRAAWTTVSPEHRVPRAACQKDWTVLFYMAADNDLEGRASWQIREMESASNSASTIDADVIVQLDLRGPSGVRRLHLQPAPGAASGSEPGAIRSPVIELLDEEQDPPGEGLRRFLRWGVSTYPSRRYMVVVWGHGMGWRPRVTAAGRTLAYNEDLKQGGIALDEHPGSVLDIPSLREALAAVSAERLGGRPFDLYAADACLMQTIEVGAELASVARYLIGSEQVASYLGLPYRRFLPSLNGGAALPVPPACSAGDNACGAAHLLPVLAGQELRPGGRYAGIEAFAEETFTFSALEGQALESSLLPALSALGGALSAYVSEDPDRRGLLRFLLRSPPDDGPEMLRTIPEFWAGRRDIGVFIERLRAAIEREAAGAPTPMAARVLTAAAGVSAALRRTVLAASFGSRYNPRLHGGIAGVSVWLPPDQESYRNTIDLYAASRLYQAPPGAPGWGAWLEQVFAR